MGRETTLFRSKESKSRADAVGFLRGIADRIEAGTLTLRQGAEEISLEFPDQIVLELKVEDEESASKGTEHSLEIELKWYDKAAQSGPVELG
ncbi:amphi-Trp domain-containing protein [uncultured Roseibium sp.]|uniref:amphi-Trp domain-containing protein n=1 Tax=uncultured Roseibium sp. TaxID=1936171 RepID=UPI00260C96A0|nr:amphi-Trp domain-containing protein [uncultured Roseibium sp.]